MMSSSLGIQISTLHCKKAVPKQRGMAVLLINAEEPAPGGPRSLRLLSALLIRTINISGDGNETQRTTLIPHGKKEIACLRLRTSLKMHIKKQSEKPRGLPGKRLPLLCRVQLKWLNFAEVLSGNRESNLV